MENRCVKALDERNSQVVNRRQSVGKECSDVFASDKDRFVTGLRVVSWKIRHRSRLVIFSEWFFDYQKEIIELKDNT